MNEDGRNHERAVEARGAGDVGASPGVRLRLLLELPPSSMKQALWIAMVALQMAVGRAATPEKGTDVFESSAPLTPESQIDKLVFVKLSELNLQPVLCSDAVFVRRAFLDVIGTLPTAKEARQFIQDKDPSKRRVLIDRLLERDEFADYWAMKWGDVLRIKAEFPVNLWPNAAQAYHRWVRASIAENKPYDKFVREMLTASGSNFRVGPVNFYRAIQNRTPEGIAGAVALTFMGARADSWPKDRVAGMAVFFSQVGYKPTSEWKEEHVFWDPLGTSAVPGNSAPGRAAVTAIGQASNSVAQPAIPPRTNDAPPEAMFPDGTKVKLSPDRDPREVFADWLVTSQNPWFRRSVVNRVWAWLLGRGIFHEPDDFRVGNPPSNLALLNHLAQELVASRYDLKRTYRSILNSKTYQLSSMPRVTSSQAEANFASYPLRRLDAEVLIDAINKITGTTDLYTSPIPEPFTYIPEDKPAIAIADGSITSPFLALFGRSARATGMENERNNRPVPAQWLHLLNSSHIQRKLEQGPKLRTIIDSGRKQSEIIEELYLTILSRFPTPEEVKNAEAYGQAQPAKPAAAVGSGKPAQQPIKVKRREDWVDIAWSLINSSEFLYRH
ncbi:MAG: DUF1553 domain-containing protein [Verrucomicrobia bacterium]|nr:DUF1553 domain-containing protein [Verrucomicrobiota bacterium]